MTTTHTPGPWRYQLSRVDDTYPVRRSFGYIKTDGHKPSWRIAAILDAGSSPEIEADANGRFIAAAPEMLEALRALVEEASGTNMGAFLDTAESKARALIARIDKGDA